MQVLEAGFSVPGPALLVVHQGSFTVTIFEENAMLATLVYTVTASETLGWAVNH